MVEKAVSPDRCFWVQVARGSVQVNGTLLMAGDAAALEQIEQIALVGQVASEILIFDLA